MLSKLEESCLNFPKLDKPTSSNTTHTCENYIISKVTTKVNYTASEKRTIYLKLVSSDLFGPVQVTSYSSKRYFITFINSYSKWLKVDTLATKN